MPHGGPPPRTVRSAPRWGPKVPRSSPAQSYGRGPVRRGASLRATEPGHPPAGGWATEVPGAAGGRSTESEFLACVAQEAQASGAIPKAQQRAGEIMQTALEAPVHTPMNGRMDVYQQLAGYALSRRS